MTMTDITIPPDARKAAWEAFVDASMNEKLSSEECVDAACIAMLKAWPGMDTGPNIYGRQNAIMHLPLSTENTND